MTDIDRSKLIAGMAAEAVRLKERIDVLEARAVIAADERRRLERFVALCDRNVRAARAQVMGKHQTTEEQEETHALLAQVMNALEGK